MRLMTQSGSIPIRAGSAGTRMLTMGLLFGLPAAHAADYKIVYAFQAGSDGAAPIGKLTPSPKDRVMVHSRRAAWPFWEMISTARRPAGA